MKNRRSVYIKSFLKRLKASGVLVPVLIFAVLFAAAVIIGVAVSKGSSGGKLVVCLDPGHGGEDFGTVDSSDERWEKVDNLEFALLVKEKLCEGGAEVIMTREEDKTVSLSERCKKANRKKADYFICLHRNGSDNTEAKGVEIWISENAGKKETLLAENILKELKKAGISDDRGIKKGFRDDSATDFYINANTNMPSCLVEMLFVTNEEDNKLFDEKKEAFAEAVADAIFKTAK